MIDIGGNTSPMAAFTISAANPLTFTHVTFTSTSTDSDGTIVKIEWDLDNDGNFDDGSARRRRASSRRPARRS